MSDSSRPSTERTGKTIFGFDFGKSRIGVAVGQSMTGSVKSVGKVSAKNFQPDWPGIDRLVEIWEPEEMVVGVPAQPEQSTATINNEVRNFARQLNERFNLCVQFINEELSTQEAMHRLASSETPISAQKRKLKRDRAAAEVILETWLNFQTQNANFEKGSK